jgi:hypothetical protein
MAIRRINSISFLLNALSLKGNPFKVTIGAMNECRYAAIRAFIIIIKSFSQQGQNSRLLCHNLLSNLILNPAGTYNSYFHGPKSDAFKKTENSYYR